MIVGLCRYHLGAIFFELVMVENPRFAIGISMPSLTVPETQEYFRFGRPYCCFRLSVVTRCRNHSRITNTVFAFAIVDNSRFAAEKNAFVFLPCDASIKRDLCRHAVSVCVCPSMRLCLSRSYILSKRINISSIFLTSGSPIILVFPYQTRLENTSVRVLFFKNT